MIADSIENFVLKTIKKTKDIDEENAISVISNKIYDLNKKEENDDCCYLIMFFFDEYYNKSEFEFLNKVLSKIDVLQLNSFALHTFLTVASWGKNKLAYYNEFYNKVLSRYNELFPDDQKKIESLTKAFG